MEQRVQQQKNKAGVQYAPHNTGLGSSDENNNKIRIYANICDSAPKPVRNCQFIQALPPLHPHVPTPLRVFCPSPLPLTPPHGPSAAELCIIL